jgi:hypothetical protein
MFFVTLDKSDIATPSVTVSFFKNEVDLCQIFDFLGLGDDSLP